MATRTTVDTPLAVWLDQQLTTRGWGVRTLARRITPADPEIARRMLNRCLFAGSYPTDEYRALIAAALDMPVAEVPEAHPFRGEAA
jgi:hypothetical protein